MIHRTLTSARLGCVAGIFSLLVAVSASAQSLPIGTLVHDGPPTPEQLSLLIPVTGSLPDSATASVRYRQVGSSPWKTGHAMFRIRPQYSTNPAVGSVLDAFAWPIIDLTPGTAYEVEVTVTSGSVTEVQTDIFSTRSLPPASPPANKTIATGSSGSAIQSAFNGLNAGDVIEFENGTYTVNNLAINRSGTANSPIIIRGASRNGVILEDTDGYILRIQNASNVIIENLTLKGRGVDGGTSSGHIGISGGNGYPGTTNNTIRNITIDGVDRGITFYEEVTGALVYDNTIIGNNVWNSTFLGDNRTWDDDGINLPGSGNVAFNNTISGFGDTFSYAQHVGSDTLTYTFGTHYYRNDIRNSLDDLVEVDHGHRNISFYDNRSHNTANCGSLDPLYGGPWLFARNVCINPARVNLLKWNDTNSGQFLYNNTFISTKTATGYDPDVSGWYQPNVGAQRAYGYQNNILIYGGDGNTLWIESTGHNPIDWTNNSWYPNRQIQWGNTYSNLAAAQNGLSATTPIFSGSTHRMENDNITTANPWTTTITLGANSLTEVTQSYTPVLANGTSPKNSGTNIPNITDGYSGTAPDRGALIEGRPVPGWGDGNGPGLPPPHAPMAPLNLTAE